MNKKLLVFLLVGLFLISFTSALTFDNRLTYEEESKTVIIKDHFNLPLIGGDLVKVKLEENTYLCGVECFAIWNVTIYADDDNFLTDLIFKQIEGRGGVSDYKFEYISKYKDVTYNDYGRNCDKEGELGYCERTIIGTHTEKVPVWETFNPERKLPVGNYIIKLTGTKLWQDTIDWIPTFYGKEIKFWAFWAASDPTTYWRFNEAPGAGTAEDDLGIKDLTVNSPSTFVVGKLNNAWNASTSASAVKLTTSGASQFAFGTGDFTIAMWINMTSGGSFGLLRYNEPSTTGWGFSRTSDTIIFVNDNLGRLTIGGVNNNLWNRFVIVREGTGANQFKGYVNNVNVVNGTFSQDVTDTSSTFEILSPNSGTLQLDDFQIYKGYAFTVADVGFDYNGGSGREANDTSISSSLTIELNTPTNDTTISSSSLIFNATGTPKTLNLTNATIRIYNTTTNLFNQSNISMDVTLNDSIFNIGNLIRGTYFWNIEFCGIIDNETASTLCNVSISNRTFSIGSLTIDSSFPEFTYETAEETFQENVTLLPGDTISSVNFIYNGSINSATSSLISGNNYSLESTIDIPTTAIGQNTTQFFFSINFNTGQDNLSAHNHSVGVINLSIFGHGIGGLPYLNFTFQNETVAQEAVSATFSSSWTYYLGSGSITKTLLFTNATENFNYSFQFHPQNRTLFADMTATYANSESQQRSFNPSLLTLSSPETIQTLLLLPTSNGVFQQFVTQTLIGNTITDVNFVINRSIGGVSTLIDSGTTDGSGFASIFLNPDFTYNAIFSKTGFLNNIFSFQPSNQLRTIVMGSSVATTNGSTISRNTNITIFPLNSSLNNGTDFLFGFNVSSNEPINLITMNITNLSGFQVGFQTNAGPGFISQTINTGENGTFIGTFIYSTGNETITFNKVWQISLNFVGDYSIFRQFTLYTTYGFEDFIRLVLVLSFIAGVLIFMTSGETFDTSESKIAVLLLLIWAFSIVGWLNTGIPITDSGGFVNLSRLSNQYGIAILATGVSTFFVGRRIFT